jgi:hypothetical protein
MLAMKTGTSAAMPAVPCGSTLTLPKSEALVVKASDRKSNSTERQPENDYFDFLELTPMDASEYDHVDIAIEELTEFEFPEQFGLFELEGIDWSGSLDSALAFLIDGDWVTGSSLVSGSMENIFATAWELLPLV